MEMTSGEERATSVVETGELLYPGLKTLGSPKGSRNWVSGPNRILIADDDDEFVSLIEQLGGRLGCGVAVARDFPGFQAASADNDPEVIFLGLSVGGHDAVEILRYLSERRCRAYIVLVGAADVKVLEAAERLGRSRRLTMQPSLAKPVSVASIRAFLRKIMVTQPRITLTELREGIDEKRFLAFFQPVVDLVAPGNPVLRAEVLARWDHPFHGMLSASEFIEAAEEHGVMAELTAALMDRALDQMSRCREAGFTLPFSINVSAQSLADLNLPDKLSEIVSGYGFGNDLVMIEVTESAMTEDRLDVLEVLTRLRMKGFHLAMDDFGTGYSTLLELVRLPFNEIKIDQRFVERLEIRRESDVVIGSTVSLAHGLGMKVCAEGVESRSSLEFLERAGCDAAQGRYIHEPVSGEDLRTSLRSWDRPDKRNRWGSAQPEADASLL